MLYHGTNPIMKIIAVEHLRWDEGVFTVPPRAYASLAFRLSGTATISYGSSTCLVNANDVLYVPQGLGYTAAYTDTELLVIHFVTAHKDTAPQRYALENGEQIYKMFLRAKAIWEDRAPACDVQILSQLYGILGEIGQNETQVRLPAHFLKAVSYINSHFTEDISADDVCAQAGMSGTVFRQLFRQYYHKSPVAYIIQLRLEYARNLIARGVSVESAALESGFHDAKYFARTVRKHFGCTPRELKTYGK